MCSRIFLCTLIGVFLGGMIVLALVHSAHLWNWLPFRPNRRTFAIDLAEGWDNITTKTKTILLYTAYFG